MTVALQNYGLSMRFGWTPEQIRGLTDDERMEYVAILSGNGMAEIKPHG